MYFKTDTRLKFWLDEIYVIVLASANKGVPGGICFANADYSCAAYIFRLLLAVKYDSDGAGRKEWNALSAFL
ncbi:hypothetical protein D3C77_402050 [compost metagenome]